MSDTTARRFPWTLYLGAAAIGIATGVWLTMTPPGIRLVIQFLNWII